MEWLQTKSALQQSLSGNKKNVKEQAKEAQGGDDSAVYMVSKSP